LVPIDFQIVYQLELTDAHIFGPFCRRVDMKSGNMPPGLKYFVSIAHRDWVAHVPRGAQFFDFFVPDCCLLKTNGNYLALLMLLAIFAKVSNAWQTVLCYAISRFFSFPPPM
jgi:hypothetical protein